MSILYALFGLCFHIDVEIVGTELKCKTCETVLF